MKTTKHFAVAALLALGATLFAGTSAQAQQAPMQVQLICQVGGSDPDDGASGYLVMDTSSSSSSTPPPARISTDAT